MTFLPIVGRELQVIARKRSSFWIRVASASVALIIGIAFLILAEEGAFGVGPANYGKVLFGTLTWMCLAAALSAGLFFTSDCLSEEKREGTLGLLFLTDLRGYDVVLGKLLATSLRAFYGLLAVFPILATTLLMGGVTGDQFWKTTLAVLNALFFSIATGLFISALSRDSQKALGGTLFLLALLLAAGPIFDSVMAFAAKRVFAPTISLVSPGYLFVSAQATGKSYFLICLVLNQIIAWTLLALTSAVLPRAWQERQRGGPDEGRRRWWLFGSAERQRALRQKLLPINPILWIALRERWQSRTIWLLAFSAALLEASLILSGAPFYARMAWGWIGNLMTLLLYLVFTSQACRFFVEARRSGLIELLLATPITVQQIVRGHWLGLKKLFGIAVLIFLLAQAFATTAIYYSIWRQTAAALTPPAPMPATNTTTTGATIVSTSVVNVTIVGPGGVTTTAAPGVRLPALLMAGLTAMCSFVVVIANLLALGWFGMWMGVTSNTANIAILKTLLFVQVIPWLVFTFASYMIVPFLLFSSSFSRTLGNQMVLWFPFLTTLFSTLLSIGKDVGFIWWSRRKLSSDFRQRVTQGGRVALAPIPPPLPIVEPPPAVA